MDRRELLKIALDSVANQTRACAEAIVIDAGHDGSDALCAQYPFVRYVRQTTKGMTPARNEALRLVTADYVAVLDSDDYYEPRFLEVCGDLLDRGADVVYSRGYRVSGSKREPILVNHRQPEQFLRAMVDDNFLIASFVVQRTACFQKVDYYREGLALADDYDLYLKFCLAGFRFAHAPESLSNRLHHDGSLTLVYPADNIKTIAEILTFYGPEICRKLGCSMEQLLAPTEFRMARHFFERGDLSSSRREFQKILRRDPRQLRAWAYWLACLAGPLSLQVFRRLQKLKQRVEGQLSGWGLRERRW